MPEPFGDSRDVTVALITGGHAFDVPAFHRLFRTLDGIDAYPQDLENWAHGAAVRDRYDVLCFYNMHRHVPSPDKPADRPLAEALDALGRTPQGILVLHHALLAWLDWPFWSDLVGIPDRAFTYHDAQHLAVHVEDPDHPITAGLADWQMVDETYRMADAGPDCRVLLSVDHPRSMRSIAWIRTHGRARVFCLESGHDAQTYRDPNFRHVLRQGLLWCARRI